MSQNVSRFASLMVFSIFAHPLILEGIYHENSFCSCTCNPDFVLNKKMKTACIKSIPRKEGIDSNSELLMQLPWHLEEEVEDERGTDSVLKMVEDETAGIDSNKVITHSRAHNYQGEINDFTMM
ncbi:hypothetical protein VIGAN_10221800 [Vigna angularis var. angularis]|uniref:Uncharacterized protein n=1 Tax=Vigna angularis var. angularis TaxID=157739 RepID=A0A0S3T6Q9_PHAAN|nr:hypothetical protein VIGAN_10221800 [Vigna angularis var. angularis]